MRAIDLDFIDQSRNRPVPVVVYLPDANLGDLPTAIFSPGYQSQEELAKSGVKYVYKDYLYLANYFVEHGYAFVTIQHDILGDSDGLETIDPNTVQHEVRKHLYARGVDNILFVLSELKKQNLPLNLKNCIVGGHSNGGDISKYFMNFRGEDVSHLILFDARRCRLEATRPVKLLMFEADDTATDIGVLPEPKKEENSKRSNLEWTIIKPSDALHMSYTDEFLTEPVKEKIFESLNWFLTTNKME